MNNPFDYLKNEREAKEKKELEKRLEEEQRQEESLKRRMEAGNIYGEMVELVLNQLRDAVYPKCVVNGWKFHFKGSERRVFWDISDPYDENAKNPHTYLIVWLDFDSNDTPESFSFGNRKRPIRTGLSQEELIQGLMKLFP